MFNFNGKRVFVLGSGASLTGFDFDRLKGEKVVAINHSYKLAPHDVHCFYDSTFLEEARGQFEWKNSKAHILAGRNAGPVASESVTLFRRANFVTKQFRDGLYMGYSSALPAVNAALIWGASEVYLLGVDCRFLSADEVRAAAKKNGDAKAADALLAVDAFGHHVTQTTSRHTQGRADKESKYTNMAAQFNAFAALPVFNLSAFSNLTIQRRNVDDVLRKKSFYPSAIADEPAATPKTKKENEVKINGNN